MKLMKWKWWNEIDLLKLMKWKLPKLKVISVFLAKVIIFDKIELKIPKNRGELYNNMNIAKSKNWKSVEIREIFRNSKKQKLWF